LGAAALWTWGLLLVRLLRDGLQPLEVWFGYSLSFLMTAVYVYLGLLIYSTIRAESGARGSGRFGRWLERVHRPLSLLGLVGGLVAVASLVGWLVLRYPGPQAVPGTVASVALAAMILAVAAIGTGIARDPSE
jgi:hypothetical protein